MAAMAELRKPVDELEMIVEQRSMAGTFIWRYFILLKSKTKYDK